MKEDSKGPGPAFQPSKSEKKKNREEEDREGRAGQARRQVPTRRTFPSHEAAFIRHVFSVCYRPESVVDIVLNNKKN